MLYAALCCVALWPQYTQKGYSQRIVGGAEKRTEYNISVCECVYAFLSCKKKKKRKGSCTAVQKPSWSRKAAAAAAAAPAVKSRFLGS